VTFWTQTIEPTRPRIGRPISRHRSPFEAAFLSLATRIAIGELTIELPDGRACVFKGEEDGPNATLQIDSPRAIRRVLFGGSLGFAEAYMQGECDSDNLTPLVELALRNETTLRGTLREHGWARFLSRLAHVRRPNSRRGARRNISRHYDLGNDFYALWLDPSLTYSSAFFERAGESLPQAQQNKYRRIAALAGVEPNDRVLEIGCGWGGFCTWAAREIGCHITAITLSKAQHDFVARRLQTEGLVDRVDLRLQDYRDVHGRFEKIVSIEMLEAVGEKYWPRYFEQLRDLLIPGGRAALQVITIDDAVFKRYRRGVDFIQRHIFPGGLLPSTTELRAQVDRAGLSWIGDYAFGPHYARTLALWSDAFEEAWPAVAELGFDERFRRMWRYYLAYCEAGFKTGRIDVLQTVLSKS
jgi:cyclopropane-fatty-acyl-phospholipid synthase